MRLGALALVVTGSVLLQGCAAALLPLAAAGAIGKTQIDAARERARAAEQQVADLPPAERAAIVTVAPADEPLPEAEDVGGSGESSPAAMGPVERLLLSDINHPYLPMARYALAQAQKRREGTGVRSAVLVEQVSLIEPRGVECGTKPFAIVIDMDSAPGETLIEGEPTGFGELLETLRESGIAIAWLSDRSIGELGGDIGKLRTGAAPALRQGDIELYAYPGLRKQERRWNLAATHCVLAVAGDRKADFDELFDYLRDPDYAIRLDAWTDRGWFLLPYPAAVAAANSSPEATEVDDTP